MTKSYSRQYPVPVLCHDDNLLLVPQLSRQRSRGLHETMTRNVWFHSVGQKSEKLFEHLDGAVEKCRLASGQSSSFQVYKIDTYVEQGKRTK